VELFGIDEAGLQLRGERIPWGAIERLVIRTNSCGPWMEDAFWLFATRDGICEVPNGAMQRGWIDILHRHLPGLDDLGICRAMGCTSEAMFSVFDRLATRADPAALGRRFDGLCERLGGRPVGEPRAGLLAAWREPHRGYHGPRHLAECLDALGAFGASAGALDVVELALWFHDAVYEPRASDNEERSAAWLLEFAEASGIPAPVALRAAELVRSTAQLSGAAPLAGRDADIVHDVDLAILGADPFRFAEYEGEVWREYAHVGAIPLALARGAFLGGLADSAAIYRTAEFHASHEQRARRNIAALLETPAYRLHRWHSAWRRLVGRIGTGVTAP
jgi:predicted metal-dependent HD superfamily phosphohydrolase